MLGSPIHGDQENADRIRAQEHDLEAGAIKDGIARKRIELLVDTDTFLPLGSLFNPEDNPEETTGVITGLAKVHGHCVCVIASDPSERKGAWLPGQPQKIVRIQEIAAMLRTPVFFLLECSGLDLAHQHLVYSGRESGGRIFYNNAKLANEIGVPVIAGIFGTNTAGGGYGGISATKRFAHKDASMAIAGTAIMSGMKTSREYFSEDDIETLLEEIRKAKSVPPPGKAAIHAETGFFDGVFESEEAVIAAMRACLIPSEPCSQRDWPDWPEYDMRELYVLLVHDHSRSYDVESVLARIVDTSMARECMKSFGPEVYCGVAEIGGYKIGLIANRQGALPRSYPEYAGYAGIGGKLYRQGLIKMRRFVAWCDARQIPMVWLQDTSGIDVGDEAERAGLLGLGQALICSIEKARIPMMTVMLRKGHAASHYVMCGPMASRNAMTLGTALTQIMVMHPQSAAVALYGGKLEKATTREEQEAVVRQMNVMVERYRRCGSPRYAAQHGLVDEVARLADLRRYLSWFAAASHASLSFKAPATDLWHLSPRFEEETYRAAKSDV